MRVFISSTYEDLVPEREAVYGRLTAEGYDVARMEDFGSRDEVPIETCLTEVERSDVYVLILGDRYGSIEPQYNLSYTHIEYERACQVSLWRLCYVRDGLPEPAEGEDPEDYIRLTDLRRVINNAHTVRRPYFQTPKELAEAVATDLAALRSRIEVRPSFGRVDGAIQDRVAYAAGSTRRTRVLLNPFVVVLADLAVLGVEKYPPDRGRLMSRKVREVRDFLVQIGANAVVFNEIPATDSGDVAEHRAGAMRDQADVIVALIHGRSDVDRLALFLGGRARLAAWYPDHLDAPALEGVRVRPYTQAQLQRCGLANSVELYLDSQIDEHLLARLA